MRKKRLSLEAFKAKVENVNTDKVLEKVQGGNWSDCHGCDGTGAKVMNYLKDLFTPDEDDHTRHWWD